MTTKQAIEQVLSGRRKPMRVPAIIEAAVPLSNLSGKTPGQTVYSVLYSEAKREDGLVVQVDRGTFKLNPNRRRAKS
jgi:HB1, ASXL, restriction endonuclease HTH domain